MALDETARIRVGDFNTPMSDIDRIKADDAITDPNLPGDELARWALSQINKARPKVDKWKSQARECDRFDAGRHFDKADEEKLKIEGRPHAVFNAAQKWLRYISGLERRSKIELRFEPRDVMNPSQGQAAEVVTRARDWALQQCNGTNERSRAFEDMLRRGMGWTDTVFDRSIDVSGLIALNRVDGHEMLWDVRAVKSCLADARWVARERQVSKHEALLRWPEHRMTILANLGQASTSDKPGESTLISEVQAVPIEEGVSWPAVSPGHVRVIEFQWYDEVVGVYFVTPDGKEDWLAESEFKEYRRRYERVFHQDVDHDRMIMRAYKRMMIIGRSVVYGPYDLPGKRFTFNCMTGQWDDEEGIWYGFFRLLMDPSRYMTKFANQTLEIITRSAKGGLVAEESAVANPVMFEQNYARTGSISWVKDGRLGAIKDKPQPQIPPAAIEMFQVCNQMLREVTGIDPAVAMGMGTGDVPMVTLQQRQAASQVLLAREFDTLDLYLEREAWTLFDFLKAYIADDRWIRVGGPFAAQAIQLAKAPFYMEYDVVLDEGTRDPNARAQAKATLEKFIPVFSRTDMLVEEMVDIVLFDLPASIRMVIKQAMRRQAESKAQMAKMGITSGGRGKPTSFAQIQAQAEKTRSEAALAQAKAIALTENLKNSRMKMALEAIIQAEQLKQQQRTEQAKAQQNMLGGASKEMMGLLQVHQKDRQAHLQAEVAKQRGNGGGGSE